MSNPVVSPVSTEAQPGAPSAELHPADAANAAAVAAAGVSAPSDLGSYQPPSLEELASRLRALEAAPQSVEPSDHSAALAARLDKVEEVLRYLGDMYFREVAHKLAADPHSEG